MTRKRGPRGARADDRDDLRDGARQLRAALDDLRAARRVMDQAGIACALSRVALGLRFVDEVVKRRRSADVLPGDEDVIAAALGIRDPGAFLK